MWHGHSFLICLTLRTGAIFSAVITFINCFALIGAIFFFPIFSEIEEGGSIGLRATFVAAGIVLHAFVGLIVFSFLVVAIRQTKFKLVLPCVVWTSITSVLFCAFVITNIIKEVYYTIPLFIYVFIVVYVCYITYSYYWKLREDAEFAAKPQLNLTKAQRIESFASRASR